MLNSSTTTNVCTTFIIFLSRSFSIESFFSLFAKTGRFFFQPLNDAILKSEIKRAETRNFFFLLAFYFISIPCASLMSTTTNTHWGFLKCPPLLQSRPIVPRVTSAFSPHTVKKQQPALSKNTVCAYALFFSLLSVSSSSFLFPLSRCQSSAAVPLKGWTSDLVVFVQQQEVILWTRGRLGHEGRTCVCVCACASMRVRQPACDSEESEGRNSRQVVASL